MKKVLALVALIAGVALFAGCMNQPAVEDETTTPTVEETTTNEAMTGEVTTDEVTPADEATTTEVVPEATAE